MKGGNASGAAGQIGGITHLRGGFGGNGDGTFAAGAGNTLTLQAGGAGTAGAGGGAAGGNWVADVGAGTGSAANGSLLLATVTAAAKITSGFNELTWWDHGGKFTYVPVQNETSATTLSVDDADDGEEFYHTNTASCTVTVDQGVAGTRTKHVAMDASNTVTFAAGSGVSLRRPATFTLVSNEQYSTMYLYWRTATEVFLEGDLGIA